MAILEWEPKIRGLRESLELALARTLASMDPVEVADSLWALAKLAWKPIEGRLREILELTLQRVLPSLGTPNLERSAWALRKLDWRPVSVGLRSLLTEDYATPSLRGGCDGEPVSSSGLEPEPPVAQDIEDEARAGIEHEADGECPICFYPLDGAPCGERGVITVAPTSATVASTPCGHLYHAECLASSMLADRKYGRPPSCPMCRGPLDDFTLGDVERSDEAVVDREGVRVGAVGLGAYDPAFDASTLPTGYVAANPGPHGMRNLRSKLQCARGNQTTPRPFACTQQLPGGQVSPTGDPMHEWRIGTIQSYNRSLGAYNVQFNNSEGTEWRILDIDLYGTHGEYKDGKPASGHWVLFELPSAR